MLSRFLLFFLVALDPRPMVGVLWRQRALIHHLFVHDIEQKYKGSFGGLVWSFANPLAMLVSYTILFGIFFRLRWPERPDGGMAYFSMAVLAGIVGFNIFADTLSVGSRSIIGAPQFVKKVVFPIEILPVVELLVVAFHSLITMGVLAIGSLIFLGGLPVSALLAPVCLLPLVLLTLGLTWFAASLQVYVRDTKHFIDLALKLLLHLTPVFYSIHLVPERFREVLMYSPLALSVQQFRDMFLLGLWPDPLPTLLSLLVATVLCLYGFAFFQLTKQGFADVI